MNIRNFKVIIKFYFFYHFNREYAEKWPMINEKKETPSDSKDWENVNNKFEKYFSKKPGKQMRKKNNDFKVGEIVVYPKHGVGEITRIESMKFQI